jgi:hypothetical protein
LVGQGYRLLLPTFLLSLVVEAGVLEMAEVVVAVLVVIEHLLELLVAVRLPKENYL